MDLISNANMFLAKIGITLSEDAFYLLSMIVVGLVSLWLGRKLERRLVNKQIIKLNTERESQKIKDQAYLDDQLDQMSHRFADLAHQALRANTDTFSKITQNQFNHLTENAKESFSRNQESFSSLIKPIKESIAATQENLQEMNTLRQASEVRINEQVKLMTDGQLQLRLETG
ncbi:MAG: hypothetical protein AAF197_11420, partial [Pseudomonadota bacterium]